MSELKHQKYIVTEAKRDIKLPGYRVGAIEAQKRTDRPSTRVMWLDDEVIPANPVHKLGKVINTKDFKKSIDPLTKDELKKLLDTIQKDKALSAW